MRASRWLLVVAVLALVNLPLAHSTWTRAAVDRNGVDVVADVTDARNLGTKSAPKWWLGYRLPADMDAKRAQWTAQVDAATYDQAVADETVSVRMLPDEPGTAVVDGQVHSRVGLVLTLGVDALLLAMALLLWRFRGRGYREVVTVEALEDVAVSPPGVTWTALDDGTVRLAGEVLECNNHEVVLDLGDRLVRVVLDGHANHVGLHQPAAVRVRQSG